MLRIIIGLIVGWLIGSGKIKNVYTFFKDLVTDQTKGDIWLPQPDEQEENILRSQQECNPQIGTSFEQFLKDRFNVDWDDIEIKAFGIEKEYMLQADDIIAAFQDGTLKNNFRNKTYNPLNIPYFSLVDIYAHFYQQQCKLMTGSYKGQSLTTANFVQLSGRRGILYLYDADIDFGSRSAWLLAKA